MGLSDEQIQNLLEWFINLSITKKTWSEHRRKALEKNHVWIQPAEIQKMPDERLKANFLEYYRTGGGRQNLNQIYRDRIIRDQTRFKNFILYLLDEKVNITNRLDEVLEGKYHFEGVGKAIVTSFLMDFDPNKYCIWNNKTEMGFSVLGWDDVYENKDSWGEAYKKVLKALQRIADLKGEYGLTFADVDLFLHTISAEKEGEEAVKALAESGKIPGPEPVIPRSVQSTAETMEFVMEKYLEEFIETNFKKIDFGAELELYQNEESNGRQYPTPIGNIDLLAIDKKNKEFVVIELKKGRSSDAVIGQILRYMGWVKDKLALSAGNFNVRGIIVAKEKDERLEYALKLMPRVNLFIYNVSFEIQKIL